MESAPPPLASLLGTELLSELALELRWCWDHGLDDIWKALDSELWDLTRNPWVVLQSVSPLRLKALLADPAFRGRVEKLVMDQREANMAPAWFQHAHPKSPLTRAAYFCMEFGLSEALPIYSGGLGNVAGDQLKAASDLGVPVVAIGLLYQQGYFRQSIEADGHQTELYPYNAPGQLPITRVHDKDGEWLRLEIALPGHKIWLRTWEARIGRVRLYLLDSNDPANSPANRRITSELYSGGPELRLSREVVLGIAGWRLLHRLGIRPEVCHLNEGHAAFAVLERARIFMQENGCDFASAMAATRSGNLFTTHTPVAAGFDRFAPHLMQRFLRLMAEQLGTTAHELMALGRLNPDDPEEPFNMAYLAIRGSVAINAVSRLHREVSQVIFQDMFPRWPQSEVPVGYVTNGVHTPSWDSVEADRIWNFACASGFWRGTMEGVEKRVREVKDETLWEMRSHNRRELVAFTRNRLIDDLAATGADDSEVLQASTLFDPNALTLGFARRFASYKRPTLMLHDPDRLIGLLTDRQRPVQLIIAGKAHPADIVGKTMVQQWVNFTRRPEVRGHVVFISDYDLRVAERLVQGGDVWINNPAPPLGSQRHQRHEDPGQRRAQSVGARRMVGRGIFAGGRMGDW
jgi:starch phosphorylase